MVSVHQSKLLFHAGLLFLSTFISLLDRVIYSISGSKYFFSYVCHWKWSTRSRGYYIPFRWYVIVRAFSFIQRKWIFREVMWNDNKRAQFFSCFFSSAFLIFSKISLKSALLLSVRSTHFLRSSVGWSLPIFPFFTFQTSVLEWQLGLAFIYLEPHVQKSHTSNVARLTFTVSQWFYGDPRFVSDTVFQDIVKFKALQDGEDPRFCDLVHLVKKCYQTF